MILEQKVGFDKRPSDVRLYYTTEEGKLACQRGTPIQEILKPKYKGKYWMYQIIDWQALSEERWKQLQEDKELLKERFKSVYSS